MSKSLTAAQVAALTADGKHFISKGLYLQIRGGGRSWLFRYELHGRPHWLGLGSAGVVGLARARAEVQRLKLAIYDGVDPATQRRQERGARRDVPLFAACAAEYIESHQAGWKNAKHASQWANTLKAYAFPIIGKLPVNAITVDHILQILRPIWSAKAETAGRVRGRIEAVLSHAKAAGHRSGENPAAWETLQHSLPARSKVRRVVHHAAMSFTDLPAFMAELRAKECVSARALEFCILTGARTANVITASWSEIDLVAGIWAIPAGKMKSEAPHRVPLAPAAIALIKSDLPHIGLVFHGAKKGRGLTNMAMLELLRGMRPGAGLTVHGFRSTFRDWCSSGGVGAELAERALAHAVKGKAQAAYLRTDLLEERRPIMRDWAEFCYGEARAAPAKAVEPAAAVEPAVNPWRQLQGLVRSLLPEEDNTHR